MSDLIVRVNARAVGGALGRALADGAGEISGVGCGEVDGGCVGAGEPSGGAVAGSGVGVGGLGVGVAGLGAGVCAGGLGASLGGGEAIDAAVGAGSGVPNVSALTEAGLPGIDASVAVATRVTSRTSERHSRRPA
jgi:hypothetical protein